MMRTPPFWYRTTEPKDRFAAAALSPAGFVYGWAVRKRFDFYYPVPFSTLIFPTGRG